MSLLDRLFPGEGHLPPSRRQWARVIPTDLGEVLELRSPTDGQTADPEEATRHQYLVARGYLWRRHLRPAPLNRPRDVRPWLQGDGHRWRAVSKPLGQENPIWLWARDQSRGRREPLRLAISAPVEAYTANPDEDPTAELVWRMPPRDPSDDWGDITSYDRTTRVACPIPGCPGFLVWDEARYAAGHRACQTLDGVVRHLFARCSGEWPETTLRQQR